MRRGPFAILITVAAAASFFGCAFSLPLKDLHLPFGVVIPVQAVMVAYSVPPAAWVVWAVWVVRGDVTSDQRLRRSRSGRCPACGYALHGNVSGVCPECGTPVGSR